MKKHSFYTKVLPIMLFLIVMASCTDWIAEYRKRLTEAYDTVKDKYEYAKKIYQSRDTTKVEPLASIDKLTTAQLARIKDVYTDNADSIEQYHPEQWMVLHNNDYESDNHFFEDSNEFAFPNTFNDYLTRDTLAFDEEFMNLELEGFETHFLKPIKGFKYLLVITDQIVVEPKIQYFEKFEGGLILAKVQVYDLVAKREVDSFEVTATNSERVGYKSGTMTISGDNVEYNSSFSSGAGEIDINLRKNLRNNAIASAYKRLAKK